MYFKNTETRTFAGSAGSNKPAVVERFALYDREGNEVAFFNKSVSGTITFEVNGVALGSLSTTVTALSTGSGFDLPTADPETAGALWNDAGTVKVSAGA